MNDETATGPGWATRRANETPRARPALALVWLTSEPWRIGELALLPRTGLAVLGRGDARPDDPGPRLIFGRARPGHFESRGPLTSPSLSRRQLSVRQGEGGLEVEHLGKSPLARNGHRWEGGLASPGDLLTIAGEIVILVTSHEEGTPPEGFPAFAFGGPDPFGMVGESSRAWQLRREISFYAARPGHALITGPSGSGKELAARALHALSPRASGPFMPRSAATLPPGIIDAELFGNRKGYPQAGMPQRAGLVGSADGGTLFLDEIGEISSDLQAHLLRLLDDGEYHRLGEDEPRRADLRFVGATNRDESSLKHDLAARLTLRLSIPGLEQRPADIALMARALLQRLGSLDPAVASRFFERREPRIDPALIEALVRHEYTTHTRELEMLLLLAMASSPASFVELGPEVESRLRLPRPQRAPPTREEIEEALARASHNVSQAWVDLGLSSRDALNRLIKKYGITPRKA